MKYRNAEAVLPYDLLQKVREYVPEGLLYIGSAQATRRKWGELSGARTHLDLRNAEIRARYQAKESIDSLARRYFLSVGSIKRILYGK